MAYVSLGQASASASFNASFSTAAQQAAATVNDIFNPLADTEVAGLVLLSQGHPVKDTSQHSIEALVTSPGVVQALKKTPAWDPVAAQWAKNANTYNAARSRRRKGTAIKWWYDDKPGSNGHIRGFVVPQYGNGPDDRADLMDAIANATVTTANQIKAQQAAALTLLVGGAPPPAKRPPHLQSSPPKTTSADAALLAMFAGGKGAPPPANRPPHLPSSPTKAGAAATTASMAGGAGMPVWIWLAGAAGVAVLGYLVFRKR